MTDDLAQNIFHAIEKLYPFNYSVCSDEDVDYIKEFVSLLPFDVHRYSSGEELNGWVIPKGWKCLVANLYVDGQLVFDGVKTKLGCSYLSPSFKGSMSKSELLEHCAYRKDLPEAVVYDWTRLYRNQNITWGLSIPWSILELIPNDAICQVEIISEFYEYTMPILDFYLPGKSKKEFLVNAHNCHPYQANDDLSGCAVAIEIFKNLASLENRRYSYRLLIAPELYGPMFWLRDRSESIANISACILLKSVGNSSSIKLQQSFSHESYINSILELALKHNVSQNFTSHSFRSYYGNDETVFEAPGIRIPSVTLTRFPFNEYHTSFDTPKIIDPQSLKTTYNIVWDSIRIIESDFSLCSPPPGLFCLSNPKYGLYKKSDEPGISDDGNLESDKQWHLLMNCLPMHVADTTQVSKMASMYNIDYFKLLPYLKEWVDKGLAQISPVSLD